MNLSMERLKRRADFLRVASVRRKWVTQGLLLQVAPTPDKDRDEAKLRIGFTVSKKVGNAVRRNRARRRLKAVAQDVMAKNALGGIDYVIIGRGYTVTRSYDLLLQDLQTALQRLNAFRAEGD